MSIWNKRPESEGDRVIRLHSEAVQEERNQRTNDQRREQGQAPLHCGVPASTNALGDYECGQCSEVGF